jgi:hypothetical protein
MTAATFEVVDASRVRRKKAAGPRYVARKPMQLGGRKIKVGDVVSEAGSWPRVESWVRSGYLDLVEV